MKKQFSFIYIICILVFALSFLCAHFLQVNEVWKGFATLPGISALFLALYKSWKDEWLQKKQQDFMLGTASHMAEVAYDKHVEFCEHYVERVQLGFQELIRDGDSSDTARIGVELVNIRQKYSAWLTKDIEDNLEPFEGALQTIGRNHHFLELSNLPIGEKRNAIVDKTFELVKAVLNDAESSNRKEVDLSINAVIEKIRDILGINTLTKLRTKAITLALKRLDN